MCGRFFFLSGGGFESDERIKGFPCGYEGVLVFHRRRLDYEHLFWDLIVWNRERKQRLQFWVTPWLGDGELGVQTSAGVPP